MPDIFINKQPSKSDTKNKMKPNNTNNSLNSETEKNVKTVNKKNIHELLKRKNHPLSSFCYYPERVSFVNEDPEEKIILLLRKHPITNLRWMVVAFIMLLAPFFFFLIPPLDLTPFDYQFALSMVWYLITAAFIFEEFLSWFFHVNIVTDERIIEVDFHNLIHREITDANIDQIQDVTSQIGGGLRTFLNYGNVFVQTASEVPRIEFEAVPKPDVVSRVLRELRLDEEQEKIEGRVR